MVMTVRDDRSIMDEVLEKPGTHLLVSLLDVV